MGKMTQVNRLARTLVPRGFPLTGELGPESLDVPRALLALESRAGLVALDSAGGAPARWSIVAFDPFDDFGRSVLAAPRSLGELGARLDQLELGASVQDGLWDKPFAGGFIGGLAYELGAYGEELDLPAPARPVPPIVGGLYGDWILFEHGSAGAHGQGAAPRTTLFLSEGTGGRPILQRYASVVDELRKGGADPDRGEPRPFRSTGPRRATSAEVHRARVESARSRIAEGEIYQANVAHRMVAETDARDVDLFLELRRVNAAPYMGFCRFPFVVPEGADGRSTRGAILSASPELLLELGPGSRGDGMLARTRPIKGTIGRGGDPAEDEALKSELLASEKDRAELAMIVDLERNDLGRIAEPGGVRVAGFPSIETYASVHHLVADVVAKVREGVSALEVVASLFPGGSITGAPKLRSMEVIAELEAEGRGHFTGSMGFIDLRGRALLNILIRTIIYAEGAAASASGLRPDPSLDGGPEGEPKGDAERRAEVSFHVGGGITWNSEPGHEDHETLLKAEGLLRALGLTGEADPG